jgi:C-terminal processing protease CtpA/Prc
VVYKSGETSRAVKYPALKATSPVLVKLNPMSDSLFIAYRKSGIRYLYLDKKKNNIVLKIDRFAHRKHARVYRKVFRKLKRNKSEHLIIDLRNNGGGSLANSYRLLSYLLDTTVTQTFTTAIRSYPYKKYTKGNLWFKFTRVVFAVIGKKTTRHDTDYFVYTLKQRQKNHFNGKVTVLINGGSFSASCLVSAYLRQRRNVVFIGEETGGAREGCNAGITPYYKLPATGLNVRVPAFRIIHDVSPDITGRGILPDIKIAYSIEDILNRKDLELEKVKEMIVR